MYILHWRPKCVFNKPFRCYQNTLSPKSYKNVSNLNFDGGYLLKSLFKLCVLYNYCHGKAVRRYLWLCVCCFRFSRYSRRETLLLLLLRSVTCLQLKEVMNRCPEAQQVQHANPWVKLGRTVGLWACII